ncbi:MAG: hypothetical protein LQ341_005872 [Variospora aurantia]|nr:MAG: hypothetical protein LQ341_005872 [Variospora aurantia]
MVLNQIDPKPTLEEDEDNSTAYSARTPPSTIAADPADDLDQVKDGFKPSSSTSSSVPSTIAADPDPLDNDDDPKLSRSFNSSSSSSPSPLSFSLVPWPNSTFVIRCVSSGRVITLLEGQITFTTLPPRGCRHHGGGGGSVHWACVESNGWLGFLNIVSGRYLGHDSKGKLCCSANRHRRWEHFCVRKRPQGGYVLLMRHWDGICCVGVKKEEEQGRVVEKLAKLEDAAAGSSMRGIVWEFGEGLGL